MTPWSDGLTTAVLQPWAATAPGLLWAALRWFGCLLWLPGLGAAGVTIRMRAALSVLLAMVVLPAITAAASHPGSNPSSDAGIAGWLVTAGGEFVLGCVLGLGVRTLFGALILAGELIDQQAGSAMRQVLHPLGDGETGPAGAALAWLGAATLLLMPPLDGHLALANVMLEQFTVLPAGSMGAIPAPTLLVVLVQQSLSLALEIAAPVLAATSLITLGTGWLGRTAPLLRADALAAPVRVAVCLAMLAALTPGFGAMFGDRIDAVVQAGPQLLQPVEHPSLPAGSDRRTPVVD